jgi:hypothetical protein
MTGQSFRQTPTFAGTGKDWPLQASQAHTLNLKDSTSPCQILVKYWSNERQASRHAARVGREFRITRTGQMLVNWPDTNQRNRSTGCAGFKNWLYSGQVLAAAESEPNEFLLILMVQAFKVDDSLRHKMGTGLIR